MLTARLTTKSLFTLSTIVGLQIFSVLKHRDLVMMSACDRSESKPRIHQTLPEAQRSQGIESIAQITRTEAYWRLKFFSGKKDLNRQVLVDSPYWLITPLGFGKPSPKALYGHPPLHGLWYIHLQVTLVVHGNWSSYSPVYSGTKQTFQLKTFTWTKHRLLDYITANPTINARSRKQGCTEPELHPCFLSFFIRLIPTKDITHLIFQVL